MSSLRTRIGISVFALALGCVFGGLGACTIGQEGERCVPSPPASHDECGSGLACTQPASCPENYCCPKDGTSNNPFCQPGCNGGQASICVSLGEPPDCSLEDGGTD